MIIYEATKQDFMRHVTNDEIENKIYKQYKNKIGKVSESEKNSWNQSMLYMYKVLNTPMIPDDSGVAIEYKVPATSKRVDFILSGLSDDDSGRVIIIELKQWGEVEAVEEKDGIIKTRFQKGKLVERPHPSYQAWSYAALIENYNETVQQGNISLFPCTYLHNYILKEEDPLTNEIYKQYIKQAPVYTKGDVIKLREFICKYIKKPDNKKVLYQIENGKIRPSKSLQDALLTMLDGNDEFVMIDSQKVVYEAAIQMARASYQTNTKQVLIVEGGPGTGKSVLAINLLVKLTAEDMVCQYVTKNSAPREVYSKKLQTNYKKSYINNLFKGSGVFYEAQRNEFDALIVDEAHRLNEKSGLFKNKGENQTKEIIYASKFSIFFIDENQKVSTSDAGSKEEIIRFANLQDAEIVEMQLDSQFRCNGSDGYLAWLDDVLEIRDTANFDGFEFDYEFKVIDDPNELREIIREKNKLNNKARIAAGYCWEWNSKGKNDKDVHDIFIEEHNFSMSWNLGNSSTWAIDQDSVEQAGCIHTSQGLEFDYVGVIIGEDLRYEKEGIIPDFTKRAKSDKSLNGLKKRFKENKEETLKTADQIIKNTYRTLMTRGQKGCYIYCVDKDLKQYFKQKLSQFSKHITYETIENDIEMVSEESNIYRAVSIDTNRK